MDMMTLIDKLKISYYYSWKIVLIFRHINIILLVVLLHQMILYNMWIKYKL